MTAPADPVIALRSLTSALGIAHHALAAWQRAGFIRARAGGRTTLITALRGILAALRAEASEIAPYIAKTSELSDGHILLSDAEAALDRIAAAFDAAVAEAITATETRISQASRPPVSAQARKAIHAGEIRRRRLYAARASASRLPAETLALAEKWDARNG